MVKFIPYAINDGKYNMDFDEKLLDSAIKNQIKTPVLRLYGWSPACLSLGRNQKDSNINTRYCNENGIDRVRRLTGGRALLHDNELTYSFATPCSFLKNGESVIQSYKEISGGLIEGFSLLGVELNFGQEKKAATKFEYCMSLSTGADLCFEGKKLIGSAQFRKENYILQHGSILLDYDKEKIKNIFGESPDEEKITTLNAINPAISLEELCNSIKTGFIISRSANSCPTLSEIPSQAGKDNF